MTCKGFTLTRGRTSESTSGARRTTKHVRFAQCLTYPNQTDGQQCQHLLVLSDVLTHASSFHLGVTT